MSRLDGALGLLESLESDLVLELVERRLDPDLATEWATLAAGSIRLQVVSERDEISVRLQASEADHEWFWIGVVRSAIDGVEAGDSLDRPTLDFLGSKLRELEAQFRDSQVREALVTRFHEVEADRTAHLFSREPRAD